MAFEFCGRFFFISRDFSSHHTVPPGISGDINMQSRGAARAEARRVHVTGCVASTPAGLYRLLQ
ncbi:MAG: hypothetical protein ACI9R3_006054, partial [Verrucomicrobiales bacterium]